jgi:multiple sugar transport system substrate-binding protein
MKRLSILAVSLIVIIGLALPAMAQPITLRFTIVAGLDEMPGWQGIVDAWNAQSDNIKVKLERLPGSWDEYVEKMLAEIAAGNPPDIGRMGVAYMPAFSEGGYLVDLKPYAERDSFDFDLYFEAAMDTYRKDGTLYGLPAGIYTMANFVNKDMFSNAGLELPPSDWDNTWTWDDFLTAAAKMTSGEGPTKQYGVYVNLFPERWIQYLWQNGATWFNEDRTRSALDTNEAIETLQFLQDLIYKYEVAPTPSVTQSIPADQIFRTGRLGMFQEGMWMIPGFSQIERFNWGVTPFPRSKGGAATPIYPDAYVSFVGTKYPDEAWKVIRFFTEETAANVMVDKQLMGIPVMKSVAEARNEDMFGSLSPEEKQIWIDSVNVAREVPFTTNWREIMDVTVRQLDLLGLNRIAPAEAAKTMAEEVNNLLK